MLTGCSTNSEAVLNNENIEQEQTQNEGQNEDQTETQNETKTDSGRYQGQADSNFIEIKISGVPDEKATRVFMLSEEVKEVFEQLQLKESDEIKFNYFQNKHEQLIIVKIEKL